MTLKEFPFVRHITQSHTLNNLENVPSSKARSIYALVKAINDKKYGLKAFRLGSGAGTSRCVLQVEANY